MSLRDAAQQALEFCELCWREYADKVEAERDAAVAERDALRAELQNIGSLERRQHITRESGLSEWADWAQNRARYMARYAAIDAAKEDK